VRVARTIAQVSATIAGGAAFLILSALILARIFRSSGGLGIDDAEEAELLAVVEVQRVVVPESAVIYISRNGRAVSAEFVERVSARLREKTVRTDGRVVDVGGRSYVALGKRSERGMVFDVKLIDTPLYGVYWLHVTSGDCLNEVALLHLFGRWHTVTEPAGCVPS
jgi:hypothetical protein